VRNITAVFLTLSGGQRCAMTQHSVKNVSPRAAQCEPRREHSPSRVCEQAVAVRNLGPKNRQDKFEREHCPLAVQASEPRLTLGRPGPDFPRQMTSAANSHSALPSSRRSEWQPAMDRNFIRSWWPEPNALSRMTIRGLRSLRTSSGSRSWRWTRQTGIQSLYAGNLRDFTS
jgi:hypothetical protein